MIPELSVCVPTLGGYDRVATLLRSFAEHNSHIEWEAVICDSGNRVRGYTQPQNQAMNAARGDLRLAVNDDIIIAAPLDPLIDACRAGAWCATPSATVDGPVTLYAPYCMLWRADAWTELGGLDEQFEHWCSDLDIAMRLFQAGHPPVLATVDPPIRHEVSATSNQHHVLHAMCQQDLQRFQAKWRVDAETAKHAMAAGELEALCLS